MTHELPVTTPASDLDAPTTLPPHAFNVVLDYPDSLETDEHSDYVCCFATVRRSLWDPEQWVLFVGPANPEKVGYFATREDADKWAVQYMHEAMRLVRAAQSFSLLTSKTVDALRDERAQTDG